MQVTITWWVGTLAAIGLLLAIDLVISGRLGAQTTRRSARWVVFYVLVALIFGAVISASFGVTYGGQFLAGWITEYSLSVDNLFVFLILMTRFAVPNHLQLRVLTVGVVIALVLRGGLIAVGAVALAQFSWLFLFFGGFLLYTAWSMVRSDHAGDAASDDDEPDPEDVPRTVRLLNGLLPNTPVWHGTKLFIRQNGAWLVTPMLLTMLAIGFTDVLFALDSIPAIFGLTTEPFLVVSANALALIGLRQLFFVVRGLLDRLEHLSKGLSLVLAFIGVKLVLEALHENTLPFVNDGRSIEWAPEIPTAVSLAVVVGIILTTALTSMIAERWRAATGRERPAEAVAGQPGTGAGAGATSAVAAAKPVTASPSLASPRSGRPARGDSRPANGSRPGGGTRPAGDLDDERKTPVLGPT
jgi:tellurite resistance protein TerC